MKAITPESAEALKACNRCGKIPAELPLAALPRIVSVKSFDKHWKMRLICWECGAYVDALDEVAVLARWNVRTYSGHFLQREVMEAWEASSESQTNGA